jgi:hypothetical protein
MLKGIIFALLGILLTACGNADFALAPDSVINDRPDLPASAELSTTYSRRVTNSGGKGEDAKRAICTERVLAKTGKADNPQVEFSRQDIAHTVVTMLIPDGWSMEYSQGTTTLASDSQNLFYSPSEPFEGVLITLFVSDGPRAVGPSFDVMKIAQDYIAGQPRVTQAPTLSEQCGRQIVTARYLGLDSKGQWITYFTGFVVQSQVLTVFLAATPEATEATFVPILQEMVFSIEVKPTLK